MLDFPPCLTSRETVHEPTRRPLPPCTADHCPLPCRRITQWSGGLSADTRSQSHVKVKGAKYRATASSLVSPRSTIVTRATQSRAHARQQSPKAPRPAASPPSAIHLNAHPRRPHSEPLTRPRLVVSPFAGRLGLQAHHRRIEHDGASVPRARPKAVFAFETGQSGRREAGLAHRARLRGRRGEVR